MSDASTEVEKVKKKPFPGINEKFVLPKVFTSLINGYKRNDLVEACSHLSALLSFIDTNVGKKITGELHVNEIALLENASTFLTNNLLRINKEHMVAIQESQKTQLIKRKIRLIE